ncbi:MAG: hypothetical protein NTU44_14350 [Bacteroidetes bacterium]|nr:hypothetical protein [Bacteroidota bacterium]
MTSKVFTPRLNVVIAAIFLTALARLIPHWPNFTPVAAVALFGGVYISKRWLAFVIPVIAMVLGDLFIGFHPYILAVYGSLLLTVCIGFLVRLKPGVFSVIGGSLLSSLLFFLITNFSMWMGNPNFTQDFAGLVQCYTVAIPFFNNGILGDLFYNGVLFGSFYLVQSYIPVLQKSR